MKRPIFILAALTLFVVLYSQNCGRMGTNPGEMPSGFQDQVTALRQYGGGHGGGYEGAPPNARVDPPLFTAYGELNGYVFTIGIFRGNPGAPPFLNHVTMVRISPEGELSGYWREADFSNEGSVYHLESAVEWISMTFDTSTRVDDGAFFLGELRLTESGVTFIIPVHVEVSSIAN
ncbi:MAG: hypothetical protein KDD25_06510 [Bdellovibrionales bacterium]|nr:hypothetical protein [Bdellovibrionales bacterium]